MHTALCAHDELLQDVQQSRLAQLVERVTSNDEVSRSSRLMGMKCVLMFILLRLIMKCLVQN